MANQSAAAPRPLLIVWLERFPVPGLLILAAAFGVHRIVDWDVWVHLKAGEWILEHGEVPRVDPFSASAGGAEWIDLHWLYQIGLVALYRISGWWGPTAVQAALMAGTFAVLIGACGGAPYARRLTGPLLVALLVVQIRLQMRPETLSFLFLALTMHALDSLDRNLQLSVGPRRQASQKARETGAGANRPGRWMHRLGAGYAVARWVGLLAVVQVLWVNCHALFVLGLAAGGALAAGTALQEWLSREPRRAFGRSARVGWALAVPLVQTISSLANPYFGKGLTFPLLLFSRIRGDRPEFTEVIGELQPTLFRLPQSLAAWLLLVLLASGVVSFVQSRATVRWWRLFAFFGFAYLGLSAYRNVALFAIVAAAAIGQNLRDRQSNAARPRGNWAVARDCVAISMVWLTLLSGWLYRGFGTDKRLGVGTASERFPEAMCERLVREPGRVVVFPTHIGFGSYFLGCGFPRVQSFIDGRLEVHESVYRNYLITVTELETSPGRALNRLRGHGVTHIAVGYGEVRGIQTMMQLARQQHVSLRFVDGSGALFALGPAPAIVPECLGMEQPIRHRLFLPDRAGSFGRRVGRWATASQSPALFRTRAAVLLLHVFHAPRAAIRELIRATADDPENSYIWANLAIAFRRLADEAQGLDEWTASIRLAQAQRADQVLKSLREGSAISETATRPPPGPERLATAASLFVAGDYGGARRELRRLVDSGQIGDDERYRARWLLALVALDLGAKSDLATELGWLTTQPAPASCDGVRRLCEQELRCLSEDSDGSALVPATAAPRGFAKKVSLADIELRSLAAPSRPRQNSRGWEWLGEQLLHHAATIDDLEGAAERVVFLGAGRSTVGRVPVVAS